MTRRRARRRRRQREQRRKVRERRLILSLERRLAHQINHEPTFDFSAEEQIGMGVVNLQGVQKLILHDEDGTPVAESEVITLTHESHKIVTAWGNTLRLEKEDE